MAVRGVFAAFAVLIALGAAPAGAAPAGSTFLIDIPTGFDDPFDGTANASSASGPGTTDGDASRIVFESQADAMSLVDDNRVSNVFVRDRASGETTLVSVATDGVPANGDSFGARIDDDGRRVVFISTATNLDPAGPRRGVYVRDLQTGTTTLVSRADGPGEPAGFAEDPAISGTGMYVAFVTAAQLDAADSNTHSDVYVRNLTTYTTELVSRATGASGAVGNGPSEQPSIEGFAVAFTSNATNLVSGTDGNGGGDVFKRTLSAAPGGANTTTLVSARDALATSTGNGRSSHPSISAGGTVIAYETEATNLDAGVVDSNEDSDVMLRRLAAGDNELISRADGATGSVGNADSSRPALTAVASQIYVAFASKATNLATGAVGGIERAYLRHLDGVQATTTVLSRGPGADGAPADTWVDAPALDAAADHVVFSTWSSNLGIAMGDFREVIVRTIDTNANEVASVAPAGAPVLGALNHGLPALRRALSADGRYVAFHSAADRLLPAGADPRQYHVYRRDLLTGATVLVDRADGSDGAINPSWAQAESISADGQRIAFTTDRRLDPADDNFETDVYVRDLGAGRTFLVSRATGPEGAVGDELSWEPALSADGRRVAFGSQATNFGVPGAGERVWVRDLEAATTTLVSRDNGVDGAAANQRANAAAIDADGTTVAFVSAASNLDDKGDAVEAVFVRDLTANTTTLVAREKTATYLQHVDLSDDGRQVAFDLGTPTTGTATDDAQVLIRDLEAGTTTLVSRAAGADGPQADAPAQLADLSADGRAVMFMSAAANLGAGAAGEQLWLRRLDDATTTLVSRADGPGGAPLNDAYLLATLDADGSCAVFTSRDVALSPAGRTPDFHRVVMRAVRGDCPTPAPTTSPPGGAETGTRPPEGHSTADGVAPVLSRLAMSPRAFRVGRGATAVAAAKARTGTTIRFTLSEAARVRLAIERAQPGRRVGRSCRKTARRPPNAKRCTRYEPRGALTRAAKAGTTRVVFSGRIGRRALAPGRYRLVARATDAAGNRSAPLTVAFAIRR